MANLKPDEGFDRWRSRLKRAAFRLTCREVPRLLAAIVRVEAARWGSPRIPCIFSTDLQPLDSSLNENLLTLFGRSNQVLDNRFAFQNRLRTFEGGIDWEVEESPAWLAELHAFDYALDLAMTYRISAEEKYARHLRYLVAHWIAENVPGRVPGWSLDSLARRVRNWILAADLSRAHWEHDREFRDIVVESLTLQCAYLRASVPCEANGLLALDSARALLLASRLFRGDGRKELRRTAFVLLHRVLAARVRGEAGWGRPNPVLRLALAAALLECVIVEPETTESADVLSSLPHVLDDVEGLLLPDGNLALLGPPQREELTHIASLAAVLLMDARWKSLADGFGVYPYLLLGEEGRRRFRSLPERTWKPEQSFSGQSGCARLVGPDSSAVIISDGQPPSDDDHADHLSFEMAIQGQRVIVDSGNYAGEGEPENEAFASAGSHNLLLIDGRAPRYCPALARGGLTQQWRQGTGYLGIGVEDGGYDYLGIRHTRSWFLVDDRFWLIVDRLDGRGTHQVTSLLHYYPTFDLELRSDRALARTRVEAVTVIPVGSSLPAMQVSRGDRGDFPGWYAPRTGIKYRASVLILNWSNLCFPWLGGEIIVQGDQPALSARLVHFHSERIEIEVEGKSFLLPA